MSKKRVFLQNFLNLTSCETYFTEEELHKNRMVPRFTVLSEPGSWYNEFSSRQQTRPRREMYQYAKNNINITTPCTFIGLMWYCVQ
jgi:hypothetical protein